ncbi:MAG: hypothetical protein ACK4HB_05125 [Candidatus Bipolaricaulia bacterium]
MKSFLIKELGRTLLREWRLMLWVVGVVGVTALSLVVFMGVWVAGGNWGENRLIVLFDPGVSNEQIRSVYHYVGQWEAISEVFYIPPHDPRFAQDGIEPERAPAGYLRVTVRQISETAEAQAALRDLPGVAAVQSYQKGALRALVTSDGAARSVATALQISAIIVALAVLGVFVRVLAAVWRGELEILYLSGVAPAGVRWSFFSIAVLCSVVAGVIAVGVMILLRNWDRLHYWLPELSQPGVMGEVSIWVLGLALFVGVVAGLLGGWAVRLKP